MGMRWAWRKFQGGAVCAGAADQQDTVRQPWPQHALLLRAGLHLPAVGISCVAAIVLKEACSTMCRGMFNDNLIAKMKKGASAHCCLW